jgi:hypothetical protein
VVSWDETAFFFADSRENSCCRISAPDWLEPVKGQRLVFQTLVQRSGLELAPFYQLFDERYTVYWKVNRKNA